MKKIKSLLLAAIIVSGNAAAQVTTDPSPARMGTPVKIIFDATKGDKGLMNYTAGDVYAHTGVITTRSKDDTDWKHAPTWGDNDAKYKMTRSATNPNIYEMTIPDIAEYYGTAKNEVVTNLAFVFRSANKSVEAKAEGGKNILVDVWPADFSIRFTSDANGNILSSESAKVTFKIETIDEASLDISVNGVSIAKKDKTKTLETTYTFPGIGTYTVTATGVCDDVTKERVINYTYIKSSPMANYPGGKPKMGSTVNPDGSVTFCLAAPNKSQVRIVGSWNDYVADESAMMSYQDYNGYRYFWKTINNLDAATDYIYYYNVDERYNVGDPYARLVLDPNTDRGTSSVYPDRPQYPIGKVPANTMLAVYNGSRDKYDWKVTDFKAPDKDHLIIYEMLFRDFTGTEGKATGNGTIRQAIEKLPYLQALGINAVELMPIQEFNGTNSWGYNTNFYFAPDKAYGSPDDYREFIDRCHEMGIAVILDVVFNQSDGLHPWYQMYPISSNPFYNQNAPHDYSVLNDWRQDNDLVQQQWKDMLQYWLTAYKVDGFRFDLVKGLGDNDSYGAGTEAYNKSRVDRMKALHAAIKEVNPNAYHINENLAAKQEENEMGADGQMNWANRSSDAISWAKGGAANLNSFYAISGDRNYGTTVSYAESHDEERMGYAQTTATRVPAISKNHAMAMRRLGSLAACMLMTPGAHMIWQFGELGADQTTKNSSGNDTSPKTVIWSYLDDPDRAGLHDSYSELIHIRRDNPQMFTKECVTAGRIALSGTTGHTLRLVNGPEILYLVANSSTTKDMTVNLTLPSNDVKAYKVLSKSYDTEPVLDIPGNKVTVPANGYIVFGSANLSGIEDVVGDNAAKCRVYGSVGRIVIEGEYDNAAVYTVSGQLCQSLEVPAGLYIVNVDGHTTKVAVH